MFLEYYFCHSRNILVPVNASKYDINTVDQILNTHSLEGREISFACPPMDIPFEKSYLAIGEM